MTDKGIPRFVKTIAVVVVVGLAVAVGVAYEISQQRQAEERENCERSVGFRKDTRAMWEWLGQQFPEGAAEVDLQEELDRLIPELRCIDGDLTPVKGESS